MMIEGKFYLPPISVDVIQNSLFNDIEDKILLFLYGSVANIMPDIFVIYLKEGEVRVAVSKGLHRATGWLEHRPLCCFEAGRI